MVKHFMQLAFSKLACLLLVLFVFPVAASAAPGSLEIRSKYSAAGLLPGVSVDVNVLVVIKAPVLSSKEKRQPVAVSLVIDRSGSMDEAKKIDYARRAAKTLIRSLEERDFFALTIYDDAVDVLFPLGPIKDKEKLLRMIDGIEPRGWTFLSGGLETGIRQLENAKQGPCRVILLSDGLANKGVTNAELVAAIGAKARGRGIGVSAIGLGLDFDEDLMQHLAQRGGGQYHYIADSESLPSVFRDELNMVVNSFTRDMKVVFRPESSLADGQFKVYGYTTSGDAKSMAIEMGDLSSEEERQVMLRLKVTPQSRPGKQKLGELHFDYLNQDSGKTEQVVMPLEMEVFGDQAGLEQAVASQSAELREVQEEAMLREADEMHLAAMDDLQRGDVAAAKEKLQLPQVALAAAAPENEAIASKLEQMRIDEENLEQAAQNAEIRNKMTKDSKSSAYQTSQGRKSGNMLQVGDSGYQVERLQKALAGKGYYKGDIDGRYSSELKEAVQSFQKDNKLDADGVAGPSTRAYLGY